MEEFFEYRKKLIEKLNREAKDKYIERVAMHSIFEYVLFQELEQIAHKNKCFFVKNTGKENKEEDTLKYEIEITIYYNGKEEEGRNYILYIELYEHKREYSNMWLKLENDSGARPAESKENWDELKTGDFRKIINELFIQMSDIELLPRP